MSQGRKKDERNVKTLRSDKRDHGGVKNWEPCRKVRGMLGAGKGGETQRRRSGALTG